MCQSLKSKDSAGNVDETLESIVKTIPDIRMGDIENDQQLAEASMIALPV